MKTTKIQMIKTENTDDKGNENLDDEDIEIMDVEDNEDLK